MANNQGEKSKVKTIFLDFDLTLTKEDNHGEPTPKPNSSVRNDLITFMNQLEGWQSAGHNVVVLTDSHRASMEVLFMHAKRGVSMNIYSPGKLTIYAPESAVYKNLSKKGEDAVAEDKQMFVKRILEKIYKSSTGRNSFYMDDSKLNVYTMATRFEDMNCVFAKKGDVEYTYKMVDLWLNWPQVNGRRGGKRTTRKRY